MQQAEPVYAAANDACGRPLGVSVFADRGWLLDEIKGDVLAAGLTLRACGDLSVVLEGDAGALGDVVLIDCPQIDSPGIAALARMDMRAQRSGAQLVISTSLAALDEVFACCDQSNPQILVDPSRAERVIALGRVLADVPALHLRELAEDDRLTLLRLTEQVGRIAERLESFDHTSNSAAVLKFKSPASAFRGAQAPERLQAPRAPLPDPRLVRRIIRQRQLRAQFFQGELFADPAWDMLLDLTAARAEHTRVCVTSLCIASMVPPTTALRWISQMTASGLFERVEDETDRRRAFVALSDKAADGMARYFAEVGRTAPHLV